MAQLVMMFLVFSLLFAPLDAKGFGGSAKTTSKTYPTKTESRDKKQKPSDAWSKPEPSTASISDQNSRTNGLQAQLRWSDDWEYVLELGLGTPERNVSLVIDTSDNFIWNDCLQSFLQNPAPPYYPSSSSSYLTTTCDTQQWNDTLTFYSCTLQQPQCEYNCTLWAGVLANETFQFGGDSNRQPVKLSFGCNDNEAFNYTYSTGYAGIGRGPLSLISQLSYSKFSYCFTDSFNDTLSSYMFFGSFAELDDGVAHVNTTKLIKENSSYLYYLDLKGISVGSKRLSISPATLQYVENSSGTIMFTGLPLTYLVAEAYTILRDAVIAQIALPPSNQSFSEYFYYYTYNKNYIAL